MTDVFTKAKRSEIMSRIRGRGNKDTELVLAKKDKGNRDPLQLPKGLRGRPMLAAGEGEIRDKSSKSSFHRIF